MYMVCCDLESVFVPEIWIGVAERTGIEELKLTTRDEPDYNKLMEKRIQILKDNNLTLSDIQKVINEENPLPGALEFLDWLRSKFPVVIVSDTFRQFADPLLKKLKMPMLICNNLEVKDDIIQKHILRQENGKQIVAQSMKNINYRIIAFGDSYNDINMIREADFGILFSPPENVVEDHPDIPVARNYSELKEKILDYIKSRY